MGAINLGGIITCIKLKEGNSRIFGLMNLIILVETSLNVHNITDQFAEHVLPALGRKRLLGE